MAQISPDEMQAMQAQAGKDTSGGATKLAQQVAQGLKQLSDMLDSAQGTTDKDKQQMAQILGMYIDLVEKKLGMSEPGEDQEDPSEQMDQVPADAGVNGSPVGPQSKN